jgi:two-component system cell cycle response regulator
VQLPRLNGFEVARRLKSDTTRQATPLIAVTAFAMVGDCERVLAGGFDGYMPKPIVPETFGAQVEAFIQNGGRPGDG